MARRCLRGGSFRELPVRATRFAQAFAVAALAALADTMAARATAEAGRQRGYRNRCAVSHGASATGDGSYGAIIGPKLPDLTVLSRNNSGVFPVERIEETIDGSKMSKSHGTRDMPIWGDRYRIQAAKHCLDVSYDNLAFVRAQILASIERLSTLQVK